MKAGKTENQGIDHKSNSGVRPASTEPLHPNSEGAKKPGTLKQTTSSSAYGQVGSGSKTQGAALREVERRSSEVEIAKAAVPSDRVKAVTGTHLASKIPSPTHEQIAERARALWIQRGRIPGQDQANWYDAEKQLRAELGGNR